MSVWFTAAGRSLFCWVCVLKWAFHSVSFLVWCHCGLPRGRVAPLDWWCWRHICTSRDSVTFLGSFHEPCRAVFTVLPMSPGNVYGYFNTGLFLLLTVRLCIYIYIFYNVFHDVRTPNDFIIHESLLLLWQQNYWYQILKQHVEDFFGLVFCSYTASAWF